jgi:hypothetical protein
MRYRCRSEYAHAGTILAPERGSLEARKYADRVVLGENLCDLVKAGNPDSTSELKVIKAIFEGRASHEA